MEEMRLADERLNVLEHPLIAHKMSIMRDWVNGSLPVPPAGA